jgi:hypothetical protein
MSLLCLPVPKELMPTVAEQTLVYQVPSTENFKEGCKMKSPYNISNFHNLKGNMQLSQLC